MMRLALFLFVASLIAIRSVYHLYTILDLEVTDIPSTFLGENLTATSCTLVQGPMDGSEYLLTSEWGIFVSAGPEKGKGLYLIPDEEVVLGTQSPPAVKLPIENEPANFAPVGMSLWKSKKKKVKSRLFVASENRVEIFDIFGEGTRTRLKHAKTVTDGQFTALINDVEATGPESFYFTNTFGTMGMPLDLLLVLRRGSLGYYDGKSGTATILYSGIGFANGMALNRETGGSKKKPKPPTIAVASTIDRAVLIFGTEKVGGPVELKMTLPVNCAVDNVEVDSVGDLWVACHGVMYRSLVPSKVSAGRVLQFQSVNGMPSPESRNEPYSNNGDVPGFPVASHGTSTVRYFNGAMWLSSVDSGVLRCEVDKSVYLHFQIESSMENQRRADPAGQDDL